MKKRFFKGGVIALLVLASGVEGYAQQATLEPKETDVIKIASQANPSIPLTVPPMVDDNNTHFMYFKIKQDYYWIKFDKGVQYDYL